MRDFLTPEATALFLLNNGLLFAINREILHPVGLALTAYFADDDKAMETPLGLRLIDSRDEEEGISYERAALLLGAVKYDEFMQTEGSAHMFCRKEKLGYIAQPVEFSFGKTPKDESPAKEQLKEIIEKAVPLTPTPTKAPSGRGAAVRKDLVAETESFSSIIKNSGITGSSDGNSETLPEVEPRQVKKIDITKMKVVNKTKYTESCSHPQENIVSEALGAGGRVVFCSLCGAQFTDTDLAD